MTESECSLFSPEYSITLTPLLSTVARVPQHGAFEGMAQHEWMALIPRTSSQPAQEFPNTARCQGSVARRLCPNPNPKPNSNLDPNLDSNPNLDPNQVPTVDGSANIAAWNRTRLGRHMEA